MILSLYWLFLCVLVDLVTIAQNVLIPMLDALAKEIIRTRRKIDGR